MARLPPELRYAGVHIAAEELGYDRALTEDEIVGILERLSAYDCMGIVGRLSAAISATPRSWNPRFQRRLVDWLAGFDKELQGRLQKAVGRGVVAVFEQQLIHLARLIILHASPRAPDGFNSGGQREFLSCLFSVPDLFQDDDVDLRDPDQKLSWALRHCGLSHEERLTLWSTYFEVMCRIWPSLPDDDMPDADAAFERYTGLSIEKFLTCGFAFAAAFGASTDNVPPRDYVDPADYFSSTKLQAGDWRPFLDVCSASLKELRESLREEDAKWGRTTFGALAFEKKPLLQGPGDSYYLVNFGSLDRRVTHGILHLLAERSVEDGHDREHFTSPFGAAFQQWAEACVKRTLPHFDPPPSLFADEPYGTPREPKRTSDVVLRYPRALVVAEVVAGPLQARTVTRGDLEAFDRDIAKLVEKKARQLDKRIRDILDGRTEEIGLTADDISGIWPVIITATRFPHRPEIGSAIRARLKRKGLLQGRQMRPLAIISAEELAAAEGAMEAGASLLELLSGWKRTAATGDHSFKNFLIDREPGKGQPPAEHHKKMFGEACAVINTRVFGKPSLEDIAHAGG
jgi:hypothetical protein